MLIQLAATIHGEVLQIRAAGVGGAAEHDQAAIGVFQIGLDRIETHVGIHRERIRLVAHEGFARVLGSGGADVTTLGIENHRDVRVLGVDVVDQRFELGFGRLTGEVGYLGLEGTGHVGRGIHNRAAEFIDRIRLALQMRGKFRKIRVQPHTEQRIVFLPGGGEVGDEGHGGFPAGGRRRILAY